MSLGSSSILLLTWQSQENLIACVIRTSLACSDRASVIHLSKPCSRPDIAPQRNKGEELVAPRAKLTARCWQHTPR